MADVKTLAESLVGLTVKEVQELAEFLKSEYGIEPAAVSVAASTGDAAATAAVVADATPAAENGATPEAEAPTA